MTQAFKCDKCKKLYETYPTSYDISEYDFTACLAVRVSSDLRSNVSDICPKCMIHYLQRFISDIRFNTKLFNEEKDSDTNGVPANS